MGRAEGRPGTWSFATKRPTSARRSASPSTPFAKAWIAASYSASFVVHEDGQSSPYRALLEALRSELDVAYPGASPPERAAVHLPLFRNAEEAQP